jgi:RNA polymerase sigma factor (sigma-70 family)
MDTEFEQLVTVYTPPVRRTVHRLLGTYSSKAAIDDVTADVWERCWRSWAKRPADPERLRMWLWGVVRHAAAAELALERGQSYQVKDPARVKRVRLWHSLEQELDHLGDAKDSPWLASRPAFAHRDWEADQPERVALRHETAHEVRQTLATLPPKWAQALVLSVSDYKRCEIADLLGYGHSYIDLLLLQARAQFRAAWTTRWEAI